MRARCWPCSCSPSLTDKVVEPIVDVATEFIGSAGVVAVFLLMTLESACIPIPSEAIMLFAGFSVSKGELTLFGIVAAGVLGNLVGSWIAYAVGYYGRLDLLEKNKLIHISPKHLKWADDWFERYGAATVFFSRMLPIVRTFISLPAGVAKMPFWRFTAYTLAGSHPLGAGAGAGRRKGRRQLGGLAPQARLPRLRGRWRRSSPASSTWSSSGGAAAVRRATRSPRRRPSRPARSGA